MKKHRFAVIGSALAVSLTALLAACGSTSTPSTATSTNKPTPGGTVIWAMSPQVNVDWYLPITDAEDDSVANGQLQDQVIKPLLWINNAYQVDWKSSIASRITYNKAGTVYHVFLNKKWHWSDGVPVTARDVLFSWNVIKAASAPNAPTPWPFVGAGTGDIPNGVKSVVQNNPYEVTFTLDKPANQEWFIYNGLIQITPLPAQTLDVDGSNWAKEIKYLGSMGPNPAVLKVADGPFKLQSAVPNQEWVLVPNKKYSGHQSIVKKVVFAWEGSSAAEFAALKTGAVNVGYLAPSQLSASGQLTQEGDKLFKAFPLGTYYIYLNMRQGSSSAPIFDHLYVRQAMEMGIDKQAIDKDIDDGLAAPLYGPIPSLPKTKFYDPAVTDLYPYNPTQGKKLLEAHGWSEQNGVMTKGSEKMNFTMLYTTGDNAETETVELLQQDWAKEGIVVTLKGEPFATFIGETGNPKVLNTWQLGSGSGWAYDGPGWYPSGGQLFSINAPSGFGYSSNEENALINGTHTPYANSKASLAQFFQYETYTAKQLPMLWLQSTATQVVVLPQVHDVQANYGSSTYIPQMQYWWVSSKS